MDAEIRILERAAMGDGVGPFDADPVAVDAYVRALERAGSLATLEAADAFWAALPLGRLKGAASVVRSKFFEEKRAKERQAEVEAIQPGDVLMRFSCAGPCLTEGRVTRTTKAMIFFVEHGSTKETRVSKKNGRVHRPGCHSCPGGANYPMGYMD